MKYKQGDILVNKDGDKIKVLGVCGEVYLTSFPHNHNLSGDLYTQYELDRRGYKKQEDTVEFEGKKYDREALISRLKELEEVE